MLFRELLQRDLIFGLDLLGLLTGCGILVVYPLVRLHDLSDHVEVGHQLGKAPRAEYYGEVCILAVFLHCPDVLLVGSKLFLLRSGGLFQLRGLLVHEPGIERDLFLYELQLLAVDLVLLVERAFLLQDSGLLVFERVDIRLHGLALGLEGVALFLQRVYLGLGDRKRGTRRENGQCKYQKRKQRRQSAQDPFCCHGFASKWGLLPLGLHKIIAQPDKHCKRSPLRAIYKRPSPGAALRYSPSPLVQ